jgi:hypothetical protein
MGSTPVSERAHRSLFVISAFLIAAGMLFYPDLLISIGVMDESLTSDIPMVRETALLELSIAKTGSFGLGMALLLVGVFWSKIVESTAFRRFLAWEQNAPELCQRQISTVLNRSFFVLLSLFVLSWLYLEFGHIVFTPETLKWINREDGVIETISALLMLLAGILSLLVAIRLRKTLSCATMYAFLAFLFIVMCGEEISWGQRYFALETPDSLKTINVQNEINLHNMFGYLFDHLFILCFFVWGCVAPLLYNHSLIFRKFFGMIGLPIPSIGLAIGMLFITLTQEQIVYQFTDGATGLRIPELRELLSSVAFVLLMHESWFGFVGEQPPLAGRRGMLAHGRDVVHHIRGPFSI